MILDNLAFTRAKFAANPAFPLPFELISSAKLDRRTVSLGAFRHECGLYSARQYVACADRRASSRSFRYRPAKSDKIVAISRTACWCGRGRHSIRRLENKVGIVAGGGGGIGAAVVQRLVEEDANVAVADLFEDGARFVADKFGNRALAVQFDAVSPESKKALVDRTVQRFGRLDILHNDAVLNDPVRQNNDTTATELPFEIWKQTLDINMTGYRLGCKSAIPHMLAAGNQLRWAKARPARIVHRGAGAWQHLRNPRGGSRQSASSVV